MIETAITHTIATPPTNVLGAIELTHPGWTAGRERGTAGPVPGGTPGLATKLRLADGRIHEGALDPERHRRIHLGLLHGDSDGYVEIAAGPRSAGGKLRITTRKDAGHFLPGGASGNTGWLDALLKLVAGHVDAGDEVCVGPAVRRERAASKTHVAHTNWLWIDVDGRDGLPIVRRLLRLKAPHLVLESGIIRSDQLQRGCRRADPCWRHVASESESDAAGGRR